MPEFDVLVGRVHRYQCLGGTQWHGPVRLSKRITIETDDPWKLLRRELEVGLPFPVLGIGHGWGSGPVDLLEVAVRPCDWDEWAEFIKDEAKLRADGWTVKPHFDDTKY